jgi:hypothetical protein
MRHSKGNVSRISQILTIQQSSIGPVSPKSLADLGRVQQSGNTRDSDYNSAITGNKSRNRQSFDCVSGVPNGLFHRLERHDHRGR